MKIATKCAACGFMTVGEVDLPDSAIPMRKAVIEYLSNNPMGIGGGTLTAPQVAALLDSVLPK